MPPSSSASSVAESVTCVASLGAAGSSTVPASSRLKLALHYLHSTRCREIRSALSRFLLWIGRLVQDRVLGVISSGTRDAVHEVLWVFSRISLWSSSLSAHTIHCFFTGDFRD